MVSHLSDPAGTYSNKKFPLRTRSPLILVGRLTLGLLAVSCVTLQRAYGATLLASPVMTGSFGSAAPSPGFSDSGGGRVGGALQPSGIGSASGVSASQPAASAASIVQSSSFSSREEADPPRQRVSSETGSSTPRRRQRSDDSEPTPKFRTRPSSSESGDVASTQAVSPDAKTQVVATTARSPWSAELGWAWYNNYQSFRGVSILDSVSSERVSGGVVTTSLKVGYARENDAFTAGFNYWQGLDRQTPKGAEFDVPPNSPKKDQQKFSLPSRDRYAEYNLNLAYTRNFFDGALVGTLGYNHFHFSNGNFYKSGENGKSIDYANELMMGLAYTKLPFIQPSLNWAHDFDGFEGDYVEARLDGVFDLYSGGNKSIRLRPYALVSYDMRYNGTDNGWNAAEVGLNVPIRLSSFFTTTLSGNYVFPLEQSNGQPRANDGFWGGVKFTVDWGGPSVDNKLPTYGKESKIVVAEPGENPWEVSMGAGWRQVNYAFDHHSINPFPAERLFAERTRQGDLGFAAPGQLKNYDNGFVDARKPAFNPNFGALNGTGNFRTTTPGQVFDRPGSNAQVRFATNDYNYQSDLTSRSTSFNDQDSMVSPYLKLDREIFRAGDWSARGGFLYAFAQSGGDSGYRLANLESVVEQTDTKGFVYSLDNLAQLPGPQNLVSNVIVDRRLYESALRAQGQQAVGVPLPQTELSRTSVEVARVATFVRSSLDVSSHDLAIPFSVRYDFGNRIHAQFTIAPSATLANASLRTDLETRSFNDLDAPAKSVGTRAVSRSATKFPGFIPAQGGALGQPGGAAVAAPEVASQSAPISPAGGGGKALVPESPKYPGKVVDRQRLDDSASEVLFGASGGASIILDLNEDRTFYAELWGRYQWIQDFSLNNGVGRANIDLSSVQAGFGVGYRF